MHAAARWKARIVRGPGVATASRTAAQSRPVDRRRRPGCKGLESCAAQSPCTRLPYDLLFPTNEARKRNSTGDIQQQKIVATSERSAARHVCCLRYAADQNTTCATNNPPYSHPLVMRAMLSIDASASGTKLTYRKTLCDHNCQANKRTSKRIEQLDLAAKRPKRAQRDANAHPQLGRGLHSESPRTDAPPARTPPDIPARPPPDGSTKSGSWSALIGRYRTLRTASIPPSTPTTEPMRVSSARRRFSYRM